MTRIMKTALGAALALVSSHAFACDVQMNRPNSCHQGWANNGQRGVYGQNPGNPWMPPQLNGPARGPYANGSAQGRYGYGMPQRRVVIIGPQYGYGHPQMRKVVVQRPFMIDADDDGMISGGRSFHSSSRSMMRSSRHSVHREMRTVVKVTRSRGHQVPSDFEIR